MDIISSAFNGSLNRIWRRRRYKRFDGSYRKSVKTVTIGGRKRRFWRVKAIRRLRLKKGSPIRMWIKLKNAYIEMMLRLAGTENVFGSRKVLARIGGSGGYSTDEFRRRLIYEISKNLFASRELGTV